MTSNGLNAVCQKSDVTDSVTSIIDECVACNVVCVLLKHDARHCMTAKAYNRVRGEIARDRFRFRFRFISIVAWRLKITDNEKTHNKHNAFIQ